MTIRSDLLIRQGETFGFTYTKLSAGAAVDLTGYTARMAIRDRVGGSLMAYLSTGADATGGTITLGGPAGTVVVAMTATQTAALGGPVWDWHWMDEAGLTGETRCSAHDPAVDYVYDLELVNGATVIRELEGRATIHRQVTT